jgi:hypothetical protein
MKISCPICEGHLSPVEACGEFSSEMSTVWVCDCCEKQYEPDQIFSNFLCYEL